MKMKTLRLTVAGRIDDENYQKTFECSEFLKRDRPAEYEFNILEMVPYQYEKHLTKLREQMGLSERISMVETCIVYSDDYSQIWVGDEFVKHIYSISNFKLFEYPEDSEDPQAYTNQAKIRYHQFLSRTGHTFCYFKIAIDGEPTNEMVVFELYTNLCPRTCENFRHLCLGDLPAVKGKGETPINLNYKGRQFFRIVKDGWIQGGDVVNDRGNGSLSIYGEEFPDESFSMKHDTEGVLGMANSGKDTNACQFYITVGRNSWMDGKYVAFGRVIEGMSTIHRVHELDTKANQMPKVPVIIEDCGQLDLTKF